MSISVKNVLDPLHFLELNQEFNPNEFRTQVDVSDDIKHQYGEEWPALIDSWWNHKKDNSLFIQFTNYEDGGKLDSVPFLKTLNPQGVYAYPLESVMTLGTKVYYADKMKYVRILRNKYPHKTLNLNYMDKGSGSFLIKKAYVDEPDTVPYVWNRAEDYLMSIRNGGDGEFRTPKPSEIFLYAIQHNMSKPQNSKGYDVVSSKIQSKRLKNTGHYSIRDIVQEGHDGILDDTKTDQIIFLYSNAFIVEDTFNIKHVLETDFTITPETAQYVGLDLLKWLQQLITKLVKK